MIYYVLIIGFVLFCTFFYGNTSWFETVLDYEIDGPKTFIAFFFLFFLFLFTTRVLKVKPEPKGYDGLPTLDQYLKKHPECRTKNGIECYVCNQTSFKNLDVEGTDKNKRRIVCSGCGKELYREKYTPIIKKDKK